MPLTGTGMVELPPPVRSFLTITAACCPSVPAAVKPYDSLRGPPAGPILS